MSSKIIWVIASCLMVLSLLMAACTGPQATVPAPTGPAKAAPAATVSPSTSTKEAPKPSTSTAETPKYGGVLNLVWVNNPQGFDQGKLTSTYQLPTDLLTNETLVSGDWSKGPAGTKEFSLVYSANVGLDSKTGVLAESWKIAEPGHMVFKIRPGVHFALNSNSEASRLVNGREVTADDIVFSLNRIIEGNKYVRSSAPHMVDNTTITAPDKYTVDIKMPVEDTMWVLSYLVYIGATIAPEVVAKYGDLEDWKNNVGSGPFMLTDYVSGSSATFVKNPKYWDKDPVGPGKGNQLPYVDGVKVLILPDPSTRMTAIRTGKTDQMGGTPGLVKDDFDELIGSTPNLQYMKYLANGTQLVYMRTDKQDLPFKDVKVRQALTMAIDYKSIVDKLMAGDGEYPGYPTMSGPDFKSIYFALKEAPQVVQDMYSYNPAKAKQLLAEAGYPNGFSTNISVDATGGIYTDQVALIKEAWSKIGVDLTIKPMERAAFVKEYSARANDQLIYNSSGGYSIYIRMVNYEGGTWGNGSYVNDPKAKKAAADMQLAMAAGDQAKADATYKEFEKYAMEQAWMIPFPRQYNYTVWQPWLKNHHGELSAGYSGGFTFAKWAWIDQDLKKGMVGGQ